MMQVARSIVAHRSSFLTCIRSPYLLLSPTLKLQKFEVCIQTVNYSKKEASKSKTNNTSDVDVRRENAYEHLSMGQKVVQAGTDIWYTLIIIAGIGVTGVLLYTIGSELFSSSGPNAVYSAAFKKCKSSYEVLDTLGEPVKAFGETSRRGRRQHVQSAEYNKNGVDYTRVKFYIKGQYRTAVVHAEMFKNDKGKKEFEYLIVEVEGYPPKTIVLAKRDAVSQPLSPIY